MSNERRLRFCQHINELSEEGRLDVKRIIVSDGRQIYLNNCINKQNCH